MNVPSCVCCAFETGVKYQTSVFSFELVRLGNPGGGNLFQVVKHHSLPLLAPQQQCLLVSN